MRLLCTAGLVNSNCGRGSLMKEFNESCPKLIVLLGNINVVRELIMEDRHGAYHEIEAAIGMS